MDYDLYSLRSGGSISVIRNQASIAGSERLLKVHASWKLNETMTGMTVLFEGFAATPSGGRTDGIAWEQYHLM